MIGRDGRQIVGGFTEKECCWLRAVLTLSRAERLAGFADLVGMMPGRTLAQIRDGAYRLHNQDLAKWAQERARLVPARSVPRMAVLAASGLRPPSMAELMAGKAVVRRRPVAP